MIGVPIPHKLRRWVAVVSTALLALAVSATGVSADTRTLNNPTASCEPGGVYHFIATMVPAGSETGLTVTVDFDDPNQPNQTVGESQLSPDKDDAAHYTVHFEVVAPAGLTITTATLDNVPTGYTGNFRLSHVPCSPHQEIPEIPMAALYPALGGATFAAGVWLRRRRGAIAK